MRTDKNMLDDIDRIEHEKTRQRRQKRSRRTYRMGLFAIGGLALLVLAAPSLVSQLGIARSMLASQADVNGLVADAESIEIGWITPLSIRGLSVEGASQQTHLRVDQIDTTMTVTDLIWFDPSQIGEVTIRGVQVDGVVTPGGSSIEDDLARWLASETDPNAPAAMAATIQVQDVGVTLGDAQTGQSWRLTQANANIVISDRPNIEYRGDVAGVMTEPSGSEGSIQGDFVWTPVNQPAQSSSAWKLSVETDSLPLSAVNLISRRMGESASGLPESISGDTTGRINLAGGAKGDIQASMEDVRIRNLQTEFADVTLAIDGTDTVGRSTRPWQNAMATLDGKFAWSGGWLFGYGFEVTTDFAAATLDGAFPTTISLTGKDDNLLSWLQTLDGNASIDVDLAALDQSLPGLIPLRSGATLVSGRASARIENSSANNDASGAAVRQSHLTLATNALRARAAGRMVMIDPIELTAIVAAENGAIRAEQFELASEFASANGSGTLQQGAAELKINFGRLYAMLRPIVDFADVSLGGIADGQIRWNADQSGTWTLGGSGKAEDLLVTLPDGHRFSRSLVQGELQAQGNWNGQTLEELTSADVAIRSAGVFASAELISPVKQPTGDAEFSVKITTDGRLENLVQSLRPWIPENIEAATGRLDGTAIARIQRRQDSSQATLEQANFEIVQPTITLAGTRYTQPHLNVEFKGRCDWPSGEIATQDCHIVGDAISLAIQGELSGGVPAKGIPLEIAWNADLARLQSSVGQTIARAQILPLQSVSYRATEADSKQLAGQCEGSAQIQWESGRWKIDSTHSATNLTLTSLQNTRAVPPGMQSATGDRLYGRSPGDLASNQRGQKLWQEPRLKVEGICFYDPASGRVTTEGVQVACDWFAGTLAGSVDTLPTTAAAGETATGMQVKLSGPTRVRMETLSQRLSELAGTPVTAAGIQESEMELLASQDEQGEWDFRLSSELGWESCRVAGVEMGLTRVPVTVTPTELTITETTIPIRSVAASGGELAPDIADQSAGQATLAAIVNYAGSPMTIRLKPGSKIESIQITQEAAATWLKYLTPLAAGATRIDGTVTAELSEALIVIDDPTTSQLRGRLNIQGMRMASGPLADQLIQGVQQIRNLAKLTGGEDSPVGERTLIEMPPQSVDFAFVDGQVNHQRMYFQIDRAQVVTSGQVSINSQLNLVAQVPLDASWLGSDLQGLAGQSLTFPIAGTLSRPVLDPSAVGNIVKQIGTQAGAQVIQNRLDGLIQKQLGTGMDQINSGLEKIFNF